MVLAQRTAASLDWEAAQEDAALFSGAVKAVKNGWILQLTEDALDLRRPDHVEALRSAYARFTRVGTKVS
ncbi:MAG: DUF5953 family protein [Vicinamibacteria bacterium]